jgi:hypothetical protein
MNGKGDKWRKTNFKSYYNNFPEDMGPKSKKWKAPEFRKCDFCGCNTNALIRRCCPFGESFDVIKSKENLKKTTIKII